MPPSQQKRANSKAAKIPALLVERPDAKCEIMATLAGQKVKVTPAQIYNLKSTMGKAGGNGKPAATNR